MAGTGRCKVRAVKLKASVEMKWSIDNSDQSGNTDGKFKDVNYRYISGA